MGYMLGLDCGIASVGHAVMLLDKNDEPFKIHSLGSRVFEAAEQLKTGASLALPRRMNRGLRRTTRRKQFRKERIKNLICSYMNVDLQYINDLYNVRGLTDIYEIRCKALDKPLDKGEFIRLLIHLSQRRGFRSNRKADSNDSKSDSGKLLKAVTENHELMQEKNYRTIGEMLYKDEKFLHKKRNDESGYSNTFSRSDYESEIKYIFNQQRTFGNIYAAKEFEEKYLEIYLSQRMFDDGPGGGSPYRGNQIEKMVGKCTLEKDEPRAPKASFSFEYFNLLCKVNALKIATPSEKRFLTEIEKKCVIKLAFDKNNITYYHIRKALNLTENELFNISYKNDDYESTEKKTKFTYLSAYHQLKKAFGAAFAEWPISKKNDMASALTVNKYDAKISKCLKEKGFSEAEIKIALTVPTFKKFGNLSVKALNKIIPFLEKGMIYSDAVQAAGYVPDSSENKLNKFLPAKAPELDDIVNPVVRRAVSQTIKIVNAVIREMGESPSYINIELARELSKNFKDRNEIKKEYNENYKFNEYIKKRLINEFHIISPGGQDIVKLKLWEQQDGICPYSGTKIEITRLFESGYAEIDHIIPYSKSFDDTYNNKILVKSAENRNKGNKLPLQYLYGAKADKFRVWVENSNLPFRKKQNLLKEKISEDDKAFKDRNLQDTQYLSRFLLNYIKNYLEFAPNNKGRKNVVTSVNGKITSYVRKRWGIPKVRADGDMHHAVDAAVIACITPGMIQKITNYSKFTENENIVKINGKIKNADSETGEVFDRFPLPYPYFTKELIMRCSNNPTRILREKPFPNYCNDEVVNPIFVSRMPKRKVTGAAHEDTARKLVVENEISYLISKTDLKKLKLKNGEIDKYYNPEDDTLLYNALKQKLIEFNGDASKAFQEPFNKPKSDGTKGPLVKKVKLIERTTSVVSIQGGTAYAKNDSIVRTDVFYIDGEGYYLVPIYVTDTIKSELPNKAIVAHKPYEQWKEMNDNDFLFSLYKNDLIKVISKKDMTFSLRNKESKLASTYSTKEEFVYFKSVNISSGAFTVINHDNSYSICSLGAKTLLSIEKYQVDFLGNKFKVNKERRQRFK